MNARLPISSTTARLSEGHSFPAGSYAVKTNLQRMFSGCTSRSSTWRCDLSDNGGTTTLNWEIRSHGPAGFTISSKQNSLTSSFSDVSLDLVDGNQPTERLVFAVPLTKVVVPSDGATPTNAATMCQYRDALLQGSLYTRLRGGRLISPPGEQKQHATWPGDFEISQIMNLTAGQPTCVDASGNQVADVRAAGGSCECSFSNAD